MLVKLPLQPSSGVPALNNRHLLTIYLHGFNSSPASYKAQILQTALAKAGITCLVPALAPFPLIAVSSVETIIEKHDSQQIVLVGSSLGGYYAFYLAEKYGLRAVLLNPAIRPYELLRTYLGSNENLHTHDRYELTREHLDQLYTMDIAKPAYPQNYLLLVQTGDDVLDYQQAVKKFDSSPQVIINGGSHGFEGFENVVDGIISFICKC